jgi:leucyl/phenylalanyl-tRNA--protein transferase
MAAFIVNQGHCTKLGTRADRMEKTKMLSMTPEMLLRAYACGIFPMANGRDDTALYWVDPQERGILPLDAFHAPRSLLKVVRQQRFEVRIDTAFTTVLALCAEPTDDRPETWINDQIIALFTQLHRMGLAHSIECWRDGVLAGGLYGLALGGAFFGESMFSRQTDASKVALCHLVAHLRRGGFSLLDTQFVTEHLSRFGTIEIPKADYQARLALALHAQGRLDLPLTAQEVAAECRAANGSQVVTDH